MSNNFFETDDDEVFAPDAMDSSVLDAEIREMRKASKKRKKLTAEEKRARAATQRAGWIRNLMAGRMPYSFKHSLTSRSARTDLDYRVRIQQHWEVVDTFWALENPVEALYAVLTDDPKDGYGPSIRGVSRTGGTALHWLRDLQPDDHDIWVAVLDAGVDPDALDDDGKSCMDGADQDFVNLITSYKNGEWRKPEYTDAMEWRKS